VKALHAMEDKLKHLSEKLDKTIRNVPNFPKENILFKDISTLLSNVAVWKETIITLAELVKPHNIQKIVGLDSRGFLVGAPLALELNVPFVMARKPSKLPCDKFTVSYGLEYGKDVLEIQKDSIHTGERVLVVDDLIATGGSAGAGGKLVGLAGGVVVGYAFVVELVALKGREALHKQNPDAKVFSLLLVP